MISFDPQTKSNKRWLFILSRKSLSVLSRHVGTLFCSLLSLLGIICGHSDTLATVTLLPELEGVNVAHCSRSVSKIDLRSQQKFQWDMNLWGKSYQKIKKSKKSAEGT